MALHRISEAEEEEVPRRYHAHYTDRTGNDIYIGHPGGRRVKGVDLRDLPQREKIAQLPAKHRIKVLAS